jgi:hypothetical protein
MTGGRRSGGMLTKGIMSVNATTEGCTGAAIAGSQLRHRRQDLFTINTTSITIREGHIQKAGAMIIGSRFRHRDHAVNLSSVSRYAVPATKDAFLCLFTPFFSLQTPF